MAACGEREVGSERGDGEDRGSEREWRGSLCYRWPMAWPGPAWHGPVKARPDRGRADTARRAPRAVPHRATSLAFGPGTALWADFHAGPAREACHS